MICAKCRFACLCLLTILFLLDADSAYAQTGPGTPRVMQGPMIGAVGPEEVLIWLRLSGPFSSQISFWLADGDRDATISEPVPAAKEGRYIGLHRLHGLAPGTRYEYQVIVEGQPDPYFGKEHLFGFKTAPAEGAAAHFTVAFGSCARYGKDRVQPVWNAVMQRAPDLFFWLGDNIYGDALDPDILFEEYMRQRDVPGLLPLFRSVPQLAVWDDHDFGLNNSDRRNPVREASLEVFKQVWANPAYGLPDAPGVFFKYGYGGVDFFFLDDRYYRDPNDAPDTPEKTHLGAAQLAWLERELAASRAVFKVLISGGGWTTAKGSGGDSWAAYLHERDRLFDFIRDRQVSGVVLLSGDTHVGELNAIPRSGQGGYDLYDLCSSPLAQPPSATHIGRRPEVRIRSPYVDRPNFGLLDFDLTADPARLRFELINDRNESVWAPLELTAAELVNGQATCPAKKEN